MTMPRQEIDRIAAAITARATHGVALVAFDGRAGAGKTTLAAAVAEHLGGPGRAAVVHGDDFFRPMPVPVRLAMSTAAGYAGYFDWQRLRDQVLVPLASGRTARHEPNGSVGSAPRQVPCSDVVIVEGVLTARPELAAFYDLSVLVETPAELCLRRLYRRGRGPERDAWIARWRAVEEHYLTTTRLHARVGLTVRGG
ncbi:MULTISPECIES: hypothetical protein [unclassified Streptomyces]|uniref:uridine kinase family protein n=1 Tax=unclassified Streptomyces TaxID=2593676 RepID=UPI00039D5D6F|nr:MULTISPECIES: hypothetical protein [unclassified Streptomyces]MYT30107.1 hypothetical protein [Streptomyces sp. SID8354]